MKVHRGDDNIIRTSWYRKPIYSNRFISYWSCHPPKMKTNLILCLRDRVRKLSHPDFLNNDLIALKNILFQNSYPRSMINKFLNNTPTIFIKDKDVVSDSAHSTDLYFGSLPYIPGLTPDLLKVLKGSTTVKVATYNLLTINNLYTKVKSRLGLGEMSNLVYSIPCNECDQIYIGQTSRCLSGRLTSHMSDCNTGKLSCSLVEHVIVGKHTMSFDNTKILAKEKNYNKRLFLEMCHIHRNLNNCLNKKSDLDGLSKIYTYLLTL